MLKTVFHRLSPSVCQFCRQYASITGYPELTKDRYPNVKRGSYKKITDEDLQTFKHIVGDSRIITDENECLPYNTDWVKANRGYSSCVLKPKTTEEVSKILKYCNENNLAVCPQGGNTGLVGGSVPVFDEIILSMSQMNQIINLDETSGFLKCEAGCVLETLDNYLADYGFMMPLDLGSKGSCQIGGNVSTNAGGLRLIRYGNLHGALSGLEAVTADGTIIDCLSTLKKDNTGFHLKHLFIGSEGSLGVVTKVAIHCPPKPKSVNLALLGLTSFENIIKVFKGSRRQLAEILSACEMMDELSLGVVINNLGVKSPIKPFPFYMVLETHGSHSEHDEEKLNTFLGEYIEKGIVGDGIVTNEPSKMKTIWDLRERITEGLAREGYLFKYDISLPLENFYTLVGVMKERVGKDCKIVTGYGHVGDGNIHLNICTPEFSQDVLKKIEPFVYEYTSKLKGSVSAEHGIGFRKPKYIHYTKSQSAIETMKELKRSMDPKGILNPYKVIPF